MTAVASPPSLQPLQRIGWNSEDVHNDATGLEKEEVSRIFLPRKILQRSSSSSSISSTSSSNTTVSTSPSTDTAATEASAVSFAGAGRGGRVAISVTDKESWPNTKKGKSLWPIHRGEGAFAGTVGPGRQINFSSGPRTENMQNVQQAGGGRVLNHAGGNEPQALLVLVPTNGTFERKSISVPLFPEILRIGRQTNAKTIPTPSNGYFDSKVLSRQHAEVWADRNGKIWIRDVKSSNGTFVNGQRLSPESRDSEPHELRENDSLELGIDIVSEDQKSIVHHKVSAKVEHAGFPSSSANVMDLTFGDLDPGASNGLLTSMPNGVSSRPRLGSQGSIGSNGSRLDHQGPLRGTDYGVQRHMNAFLSPISIETVMRKLNTELRQAKQQSHDLDRTGQFFEALITHEPGKEIPKAPASILPQKTSPSPAPPVTNGLAPTKLEHLSPFSAPPAPPPQLPLPEKPDMPKSAQFESAHSLPFKRSSVDLPHTTNGKADNSSQILSLVETLQSAKRELDIQGNRVKELEEMLKQERKAREVAEERARLLTHRRHDSADSDHATPFTPPEDDMSMPAVNGTSQADEFSDTASQANTVIFDEGTISSGEGAIRMDAEKTMSSLQERLDKMVREMEDVKKQLDQQRHRAESAESERDTLVDMVQRIRQAEAGAKPSSHDADLSRSVRRSGKEGDEQAEGLQNGEEKSPTDGSKIIEEFVRETDALAAANGNPPGRVISNDKDKQIADLQESLAKALARAQKSDQFVSQSTPYASIIGVVLLGVSAMLYLNSLPKTDR